MEKLLAKLTLCTLAATSLANALWAQASVDPVDAIQFDVIEDPYSPTWQMVEKVGAKLTEFYTSVYNNTTDYALVGFRGMVSGGPSRLVLIDPGAYKNILHSGDTLLVKLVKFTFPPIEQHIGMHGYSKVTIAIDKNKIVATPGR